VLTRETPAKRGRINRYDGTIGKSVGWIQNWLANKKQCVVIDGSTSDAVSVDSGVPQGSVLVLYPPD
jgi:hypothetical protein